MSVARLLAMIPAALFALWSMRAARKTSPVYGTGAAWRALGALLIITGTWVAFTLAAGFTLTAQGLCLVATLIELKIFRRWLDPVIGHYLTFITNRHNGNGGDEHE